MKSSSIKSVESWFVSHIKDQGKPYTLDKYQAGVILDNHKNTLVTARAGSGKTRTVVAKIIYLVAHDYIPPENIIAFAFNRKAKIEINERLAGITFDGHPIFPETPDIATTFHAFSYKILGEKNALENRIITEYEQQKLFFEISQKLQLNTLEISQFITRAEQLFFKDYQKLHQKIMQDENVSRKIRLLELEKALSLYRLTLQKHSQLNFNQLIAESILNLPENLPFQYIFVDEYQDFSLLFLELIRAIRRKCPGSHLLAVGDDWQAINRFAGSDVKYFQHFERYFPENHTKLFLPTNYRSGKRIVKNANFFMSQAVHDEKGCKSGNKMKSHIHYININSVNLPLSSLSNLPLSLQKYLYLVQRIIEKHPGKTIKILHRNNDLSFQGWSLEKFCNTLQENTKIDQNLQSITSFSTIHRSKGLESDIVILLEIDEGKFPGIDKTGGLFELFGDTKKSLFEDEARLFYVALTRPKEELYIISKTTKPSKDKAKQNFFSYLNENYLDPLL